MHSINQPVMASTQYTAHSRRNVIGWVGFFMSIISWIISGGSLLAAILSLLFPWQATGAGFLFGAFVAMGFTIIIYAGMVLALAGFLCGIISLSLGYKRRWPAVTAVALTSLLLALGLLGIFLFVVIPK